MSQPPARPFGKRQPTPASPPKRSQGVRLKMMAGAGAAALGLYAVMPRGSCDDRHFYETLDQCIAGGPLSAEDCRAAFAAEPAPGASRAGVMSQGRGRPVPIARQADGQMLTPDGQALNEALACGRRGGSSHSTTSSNTSGSSGSGSGGRRSWWSRGSSWSSSSSTSSSSVGIADGGGSTSRGGFGSSGHGFFGGS